MVFDRESLRALFVWDQQLGRRPKVEVTTLDHPAVAVYYRQGWKRFNQ